MSNLGTIYEINTNIDLKNKYPIVYSNKSYYYCKEYGGDRLKEFNISYCDTLESFHKRYKTKGSFTGHVYVPRDKDFFIPELPKETIFKNKIDNLIKRLRYCQTIKNGLQMDCKNAEKKIAIKDQEIEVINEQISSLYALLSSVSEEDVTDD